MKKDKFVEDAFSKKSFRIKKLLDQMLPLFLLMILIYIYLEFFSGAEFFLYRYKHYIQYLILIYFVTELSANFLLYESNKEFFRDKWLDILLTVPFLIALKGFAHILKVLKLGKIGKAFKIGKAGKNIKFFQKTGKFLKKLRKKYGG